MATPDPRTEAWLQSFGVTEYDLRDIPIDRWDRERSLSNQARVSAPLNEDTVQEYALAMDRGDQFPPAVVYDTPSGYIALDGNHRFAGADLAGKDTIPGYVVGEITQPQRLLLTFDANTRHGMRTSNSERIQQAVALVNAGVSQAVACRTLNVNESGVSIIITGQQTQRELAQAGFNGTNLARGHLARVGALRDANVRLAAARWFNDQRISVNEASSIVRTIRALRTTEEQLAYIQMESGRRAALSNATARGRIQLPESVLALQRTLADIDKIVLDDLTQAIEQERLPNDLRTVLASRTLDGIAKLRRVSAAISG